MLSNRLQRVRLIIWFVAAIFFCAACFLFAASTLSFQVSRSLALSAIPPGYADRFTPDLFIHIVTGMRFCAAAIGLCALLGIVFAAPLSRRILGGLEDLSNLDKEMWAALRSLRYDPPLHLISLFAVLLWGTLLRLAFLREPIRNDEAYNFMHYASRPLYVALTYYTTNNHPLNTLLMHISTGVFGASVWAVRLPTLIAGILIIWLSYAAVRLLHGRDAALLTAALVSASSPLIEYSFNARGYSLGTLFFLIAVIMVVFQRRAKSQATWILLPIAVALAIYSVPTMLYGIAGIFLYLLLRRVELRLTMFAMIWTAGLTALLYSPTLATVGVTAITNNKWVTPIGRAAWPSEFAHEIASLWRYWNLDLPLVPGVFIVFGLIAALFLFVTRRWPPLAILLCTIVAACCLMAVQSLVLPRRSWLFLLPLYFGAAAAGWTALLPKTQLARRALAILSLVLAAWMGSTVLAKKSLRHSGIEAAGPRSVESIVLASKPELLRGAQFICNDYFDSGLDFEMRIHRVPYQPSPGGDLLIVTPAGSPPQRTLQLAGLSDNDVQSIRKIAHYSDADEYLARRGPALPFTPRGTTEMGVFTESGN